VSQITFLSWSLRPEDDTRVNAYFKDIFGFYGIETETINIPGLSEEQVIRLVKQVIPKDDGVIVLWTPRYYINGSIDRAIEREALILANSLSSLDTSHSLLGNHS
jgi:hypothetical protein